MKIALLLFLMLFAVSFNTAKAAIIEVQNINDASTGSLRQAIIDANDSDTIRFNTNLIGSGSQTIILSSQLTITKNLVFKGLYNNTDTLYVSGNNTNRIFHITSNTTEIDSMVFVNGNATTGNGGALHLVAATSVVSNSIISNCLAEFGGGIYCQTTTTALEINNSILNNNSATDAGGGLYVGGQTVTLNINNSKINNNSVSNGGGGIFVNGAITANMTIENSSINYNSVAGGDGGGIFQYSYSGYFYSTINNSNIDHNTTSGSGGGIYSRPNGISSVTLNNSTVSNNTADVAGGIYSIPTNQSVNAINKSVITLTNSTISGNYATDNYGGAYCSADSCFFIATNTTIMDNQTATTSNKTGGIYVLGIDTSSLELTSSIIWTSVGDNVKHLRLNASYALVSSPILSGGYNIFSNAPNGATSTGDLTNVSAASLNLQALTNNGGTTLTRQPGVGSVAINAGNPSDLSDAQNAPISGIRDIGSTEYIANQSTGISKVNNASSFNIYPNPVKNELFIDFENQQITEINILDLSGKMMLSSTNKNIKSINVSGLSQGVYILKVHSENGVASNRFVKQ